MGSVRKNAVTLAFVGGLLTLLSACGWGSDSPYVKSVERTPSGFFRVFADIRVKETGEIINLDYVVACGGTVTNWTYTTPSVSYGMVPQIMLVPTSSGELIGARTPKVCDAGMWEPRRIRPKGKPEIVIERVPDDFLPLLMWYPNADDIGFAIGYLSDKAYESPYAKIEVLSSGIAESSLDEWRAWRKDAAENYEQVGVMPGPWGHQIPGTISSSLKLDEQLYEINQGRRVETGKCNAATFLDLPEEGQAKVYPLLPKNDAPWISMEQLSDERRDQVLSTLRYMKFNGVNFPYHGQIVRETGVRKASGGGAFISGQSGYENPYHDYYPVVPFQPAEFDPDTGEVTLWHHELLRDEKWSGFGICGLTSPPASDLVDYVEGRIETLRPDYSVPRTNEVTRPREWVPEVLVSGEITVVAPRDSWGPWFISSGFGPVFDRDGHIMIYCCTR